MARTTAWGTADYGGTANTLDVPAPPLDALDLDVLLTSAAGESLVVGARAATADEAVSLAEAYCNKHFEPHDWAMSDWRGR